jgi:hypothetical protein
MKISRANEPGAPAVVDRAIFQAELDALRIREKAHTRGKAARWIASRSLSSCAHARDPLTRNDGVNEVMLGDLPSLHALLRLAGRGRGWGVYRYEPLLQYMPNRPPPPTPPHRFSGGGEFTELAV